MGKAKRSAQEGSSSFNVDAKTAIALDPDDRATWLSTAFRYANEGSIRVSQLFDVLTNNKFANGLTDKAGIRMLRTLQKHMHIFSEKQQRFLNQSPLIVEFENRKAEIAKQKQAEAAAATSARHTKPSDDSKMEDMMARCRAFVRENATSYEDRERQIRKAQEQARLAEEWECIDIWHRPLEEWEGSQLTKEDLRLLFQVVEAEERERERKERRRKEAWENSRKEDIRRRLHDEQLILQEEIRASEIRRTRERFFAEEERRRMNDGAFAELERKRQEFLRQEHERIQRERGVRDWQGWDAEKVQSSRVSAIEVLGQRAYAEALRRERERELEEAQNAAKKQSGKRKHAGADGDDEFKRQRGAASLGAGQAPEESVGYGSHADTGAVGWMAAGAICSVCTKSIADRGGVVCGRRRPNGKWVGCGTHVCWRCMKRAQRSDIGSVTTTKEEFESLGQSAWWMHDRCMESEDQREYFGYGEAEAGSKEEHSRLFQGGPDRDGARFAWE